MQWTSGSSNDVEDRRGDSGGGGGFGGFGGGRSLGIFGTLVVLVLSVVFHQNFFSLLGGGSDSSQSAPASDSQSPAGAQGSRAAGEPARALSPEEKRTTDLVHASLDDIQEYWDGALPKQGANYQHAKLVLFDGVTNAAGCGRAQEQMGPFYCPADKKVYIDLAFYGELRSRFGAPGEFAQAYVLAHEVGHHVQDLLGIEHKLRAAQQAHPEEAKHLSVRMELQADCLAGLWAGAGQHSHIKLENGDIDSGLGAAAAVGDDRLQKQATGRVNPESFTHGSAAQRTSWFKRGFESNGKLEVCDTFSAREL